MGNFVPAEPERRPQPSVSFLGINSGRCDCCYGKDQQLLGVRGEGQRGAFQGVQRAPLCDAAVDTHHCTLGHDATEGATSRPTPRAHHGCWVRLPGQCGSIHCDKGTRGWGVDGGEAMRVWWGCDSSLHLLCFAADINLLSTVVYFSHDLAGSEDTHIPSSMQYEPGLCKTVTVSLQGMSRALSTSSYFIFDNLAK